MDESELVSAIWEFLLTCQGPQTADDIGKAVGAEAAPIRVTLAKLRQGGLLSQVSEHPRQYVGRRTLDAVSWARAVDLGININLLEQLAEFDSRDRRLALQLASEGEIERIKEKEIQEKQASRQERRLRRVKSQVAATELAQLVEDAFKSLRNQQRKKGDQDLLALAILEKTVEEGQRVLLSLQNSLLKG